MTEHMFTVSTTIQSADRSNPPTRMQWYRGTSHVKALAALVQAGTDTSDERYDSDGAPVPDSVRYIMLDVSMTVEPVEPVEPECCPPCADGEHADEGPGTECRCCGATSSTDPLRGEDRAHIDEERREYL